jgi:hypothetical protein
VAYGVPTYREWYQNELIRRVHAQQPFFEDDLSAQTGNWPFGGVFDDGRSGFYCDGAYHMKGARDDRSILAPGARLIDDAAVEATAAQKGSSARYDGVWLLLRLTDDEHDFVIFAVRQNGDWYLSRYPYVNNESISDWTTIADGKSSAIHQGDSVENRLLVIRRGAPASRDAGRLASSPGERGSIKRWLKRGAPRPNDVAAFPPWERLTTAPPHRMRPLVRRRGPRGPRGLFSRPGKETDKEKGSMAEATRLTTAVDTAWLAAGESP